MYWTKKEVRQTNLHWMVLIALLRYEQWMLVDETLIDFLILNIFQDHIMPNASERPQLPLHPNLGREQSGKLQCLKVLTTSGWNPPPGYYLIHLFLCSKSKPYVYFFIWLQGTAECTATSCTSLLWLLKTNASILLHQLEDFMSTKQLRKILIPSQLILVIFHTPWSSFWTR